MTHVSSKCSKCYGHMNDIQCSVTVTAWSLSVMNFSQWQKIHYDCQNNFILCKPSLVKTKPILPLFSSYRGSGPLATEKRFLAGSEDFVLNFKFKLDTKVWLFYATRFMGNSTSCKQPSPIGSEKCWAKRGGCYCWFNIWMHSQHQLSGFSHFHRLIVW